MANGLLPPPAGKTGQRLEVDVVVEYMKMIKQKFYDTNSGYSPVNGTLPPAPPSTEPRSSQSACPGYYSTLMCHFYCLHPSYSQVIPNVRGCFSSLANGTSVNGRGFYPEIFDYCMYQPYDAVLRTIPPYDAKVIAANKASGTKVGVLKYMTEKEEEIFKYVTYTWYNPDAFDANDQQAVLDKFYGAGHGFTVKTTGQMHPNASAIIPFMQSWDKDNGNSN